MSCRDRIHWFVGKGFTIPQQAPAGVWGFAVAGVGTGAILTHPADSS